MCTKDTLSLALKGIPPVPPFYDTSLWDRWLDCWSMNCALVLQSMVPALVHKSLSLCNTTDCRGWNIRGHVLGFGYKKYKWDWWYLPLMWRINALRLH